MVAWKAYPRKKTKRQLKPIVAQDHPEHIVSVCFALENMTVRTAIVSLESILFQLDEKDMNRKIKRFMFDESINKFTIELDFLDGVERGK